MMRFCILHSAFLLLPAAAFAQSVELKVPTTTLEVGESVDAQLICTNTGEPMLPNLTAPDGMEVKLTNPSPFTSQSLKIVNGRSSQTVQYTYSLRITAFKEGTHRLGPFLVTGGGQTLQTNPVDIVVRKSIAASGPNGDKFLYVELTVEPRTLYVTQSYRAMLTIGIRKVEIGGRVYNLENLLRNTLDNSSELSVFSGGKYTLSDVTLTDSAGRRRPYEVYRIVQDIRAEAVGEVTVGPVFLKVNYPTALRSGWFNDLDISSTRREVARADAVPVTVKGPPLAGRPADFSGAIGKFTLSVTAKPERVEQGRPITLSAAIQGSPLQGVAGPNLAAQPELVSRFDFTNEELAAEIEQAAKVFRRAIFPKTPGEQTIPPVRWAYFDPQREQYVTLISEPIRITVDPPANGSAVTPTLEVPQPPNEGTTLTLLTGGISPNYVDADSVLVGQAAPLGGVQLGILAASPLACLAITMTRRHRSRLRTDVTWARRRRARRHALDRVSRVLQNRDATRQLPDLADVLTAYLADRFNLPPASLTSLDARSILNARGVDETTLQEVSNFLNACDAARYAPGMIGSLSTSQAAADLRRWIDRIERDGA